MTTPWKKIKLLKGLLSGEFAYHGPFYVMVDLTRRCNLRCLGCRYHSPLIHIPSPGDSAIQDISFDLIEKLCGELSSMGTDEIILTGEGEPFLHPRLSEIISVVKDRGLRVTLLTNGTFLDEPHIRSLIDSRLDILIVSLWASLSEEYELSYPGTGVDYFTKVINGLKLLSTLKADHNSKLPSLVLHQPINRFNFKTVDAMVDLAHITQANYLSFSPFYTYRGRLTQYALSQEELKTLRQSFIQMKKRLKAFSIKHHIDQTLLRYQIGEPVRDKYPCYIAWFHSRIKTDGAVLPCSRCNLILGHLKENSFREIWNGLAYRTFRRGMLATGEGNSIDKDCDCGFCCFIRDNRRIHRIFKWCSPFSLFF